MDMNRDMKMDRDTYFTCLLVELSSGVQVGPLGRTSFLGAPLVLWVYLSRRPVSAVGYAVSSRRLAYAALKLLGVFLALIFAGIRFHSSITLTVKKFLRTSSLPLFGLMFRGSAVSLVAHPESAALSNHVLWSKPFSFIINLWTICISARCRLSASVVSLSSLNLSS